MPFGATPAAILDLVERLAAVTVFLSGMELFLARAELRDGGVLDWRHLSLRRPATLIDRFFAMLPGRRLFDDPVFFLVVAIELAGAAFMAVDPGSIVGPLVCLVCHALVMRRIYPAVDGSDDMLMVILGVAVLRTLATAPDAQLAAVLFLAGQSALSYLTSGLSKAQSRTWWNGAGLRGVLTTRTYSEPHLARFIGTHPLITRALGPFTIVWESAFPLAVLAGPEPAIIAIVVAASFHLACAFVMGLASFSWAFGAALPAVVYASFWLGQQLSGPERLLLTAVVALPIVGAVGFFGGFARATKPATKGAIDQPTTQPTSLAQVSPQADAAVASTLKAPVDAPSL